MLSLLSSNSGPSEILKTHSLLPVSALFPDIIPGFDIRIDMVWVDDDFFYGHLLFEVVFKDIATLPGFHG